MPQHLLQMEHVPAAPQIVHCECVSEGVERAGWSCESEPLTKQLHVTQDVSTA